MRFDPEARSRIEGSEGFSEDDQELQTAESDD